MPKEQIVAWARTADRIYAADGAARNLALELLDPIVVGDLDSFPEAEDHGLTVIQSNDQQTTDCDKLLAAILAAGYEEATLIGIEGDRFDHMLATLNSVLKTGLRIRIALRRGLAYVVREETVVGTTLGERFSLVPLMPCTGIDLTGCEWPLENASLQMDGFISISNRATGEVRVKLKTGAALVICERAPSEPPVW